MKGGKNRQPLGYTIVEVMIVLAVSGMMFVIAASFINGKQEQSAFTAGTKDMASQIQDVVEQVTDGKYSDIPLGCNAGGSSLGFPISSADQGTNSPCVFLGKLLQFSNGSPDYTLSSVAGARLVGDIQPDLTNTKPTVIPGLDVQQATPQSLNVIGTKIVDSNGNPHTDAFYVIGFLEGLGTSKHGSFQSGGQTVTMVYSTALSPPIPPLSGGSLASLQYAQSATICLSDGTQTAELVMGGGSSQLNVDIEHINRGNSCP